jgi:hypothetical protein
MPRERQPEPKAYHSPPPRAEVQDKYNFTYTHPRYVYGMVLRYRDNLASRVIKCTYPDYVLLVYHSAQSLQE